jgi:hypothetical protein
MKRQPDKIDLKKYKQFIVQIVSDQEVRYADAKIAVTLWESFNWRQGVCYAGFQQILERTGLSNKSVWRGLRRLLDRGHIGFHGDCRDLFKARFRLAVRDTQVSVRDTQVSVRDTQVSETDLKIDPINLERIEENACGEKPLPESLPESSTGISYHKQSGRGENDSREGEGNVDRPTTDNLTTDGQPQTAVPSPTVDPPSAAPASPTHAAVFAQIRQVFPSSNHGHNWETGLTAFLRLVETGIDPQHLLFQATRYAAVRNAANEPQYTQTITNFLDPEKGGWNKEYPDLPTPAPTGLSKLWLGVDGQLTKVPWKLALMEWNDRSKKPN